jgi:chaperone required for assembly of F1-ATPase
MSTDAFLAMFPLRDEHEPRDPMKAAQGSMRPPLPRRFYKAVSTSRRDSVWLLLLDERTALTPARKPLGVSRKAIADALVAEWEAQQAVIDPALMPLTRLLNAAIDGVAAEPGQVHDEIVRYAGSDLVCYRAEAPEALLRRQSAEWDPLLAFARDNLGADLKTASGIIHVEQTTAALDAVRKAVEAFTCSEALAALSLITTLTGSALIALALAGRRLSADAAWSAGELDEAYQAEVWGEDDEAAARRAVRRRDFDAAALVLASQHTSH